MVGMIAPLGFKYRCREREGRRRGGENSLTGEDNSKRGRFQVLYTLVCVSRRDIVGYRDSGRPIITRSIAAQFVGVMC